MNKVISFIAIHFLAYMLACVLACLHACVLSRLLPKSEHQTRSDNGHIDKMT